MNDEQEEIRESKGLTISKEVPLPWIVTFIFGGLANLIAVTWLLSEQVGQQEEHTRQIAELQAINKDSTEVIKLHSEELIRRVETDRYLTTDMIEAKDRLKRLEERVNLRR